MAGGESFGQGAAPLQVDVWSDVACPFCYMGTTALAEAIETFPHADRVQVTYHSFELMPDRVGRFDGSIDEFLAEEQHVPLVQARAMNAQLSQRLASMGLEYNREGMVVASTRAAHRLIHFATREGLQRPMVLRLFRAQFHDAADVSDYDTLADLAVEIGLDRAEAAEVLASGAYEDEVASDVAQARSLGATGVPFYVFDGKYALSGARPADAFTQALTQAWNEKTGSP